MLKVMPNYQHFVNEPLTYIDLQNTPYSEDAGYCESICEINAIIPVDIVYSEMAMEDNLHLKITDQPADIFRFRYKSEKGSHGGIKGEKNPHSRKSGPTVQLENCPPSLREKVLIKVSLYTNEPDPKPHVYELTGKNSSGVPLDENYTAQFRSLAITTRKKEEVIEILKERKKADHEFQEIAYDEVSVEAEALEEMKSFNLDSAKLCFEAFSTDNISTPLCEKTFSNPINNKKSAATGDLKITRLSRFSGKCSGGDEVILLCDKVNKDIKVRFSEEDSGWEAYAELTDIHHQVAIVFRTPEYQANVHTKVYIELYRPSDDKHSEGRLFEYIPDDGCILHPSNRKLLTNQSASLSKNEFSESTRKRKRIKYELDIKSPKSYLDNSSLMDSPTSSTDDDAMTTSADFLSGLDLNLNNINLELFSDIFDVLPVENQNTTAVDQMMDPYVPNAFSKELEISAQSFLPYASEAPEIFNHSGPTYVEVDGIDEISYSMGILSVAEKLCKKGLENSEIEKASDDFAIGMKRILQSRDERTLLHCSNHLILLQDEDQNSMLHLGIVEQSENWNFISRMVKMAPEDIINHQNKFKETPLHLAIKGNHVKILLLLLAAGGDPNLSDRDGNNCLHLAAKYGQVNCLKVLMLSSRNGRRWRHKISDIDMLNYEGMSALHIAVTENFEDCVNFLLHSKADINLSEKKSGRTSLHLAIEHPSLLQAILKQPNLDLYAEDFGGYTAVELACLKTGKPYEVVSAQLEDDEDEIVKFLENLNLDEASCFSRCSEAESEGESTDSSEFEDAVEDLSFISSKADVCKAVSTSELKSLNEKKSSLMRTEEELHRYLDRDDNWKKLANLIDLNTKYVALLDEGLSPGQTVLRKIKDLYHPCQLHTMIGLFQIAGLEEGIQILQKNS